MSDTRQAEAMLQAMSVEEKVGQLICGRGPDWEHMEQMCAEGKYGAMMVSFKHLGSNREAAEYINHLQTISPIPIIFCGGASHGTDQFIPKGVTFPDHMAVGAARSPELAYLYGDVVTREQRALGMTWIGAPNLDVNTEPANPIINTRAFSDRPELVIDIALEMSRAIVDNHCLTCGMHYPGHGATSEDSHLVTPVVDRTEGELRSVDLATFRAGVERGVINCICPAHILYPALDADNMATFSRRILVDLLRGEFGYDGLLMSDSLLMDAVKERYSVEEAAIEVIRAGQDFILLNCDYPTEVTFDAVLAAVESGHLPIEQVDACVARILRFKQWCGLLDRSQVDVSAVDGLVSTEATREVARKVARASITCLEDAGLPLPIREGESLLVIAHTDAVAEGREIGSFWGPVHPVLGEQISRRHPDTEMLVLDRRPDAGQVQAAVSAGREAAAVVVGLLTRVVSRDPRSFLVDEAYIGLIEQLTQMGKPVYVILMGSPYAAADLPPVRGLLLTYSDCIYSVEAAVEALFGEIPTPGRLPVSVSERYPYGAGR